MKSKFLTGLAVGVFSTFIFSCKKYLTEFPNSSIASENAIIDAGTARAAIIGAYDGLQSYYSANFPTLGTITADAVVFNGTLSQYLQLDQNAIPTDNVITVASYRSIYSNINLVNSIIAKVPAVVDPLLPEAEKNKILGEAYFIRALDYFDLARGWGGVQLQLTPTSDLSALKGIKRSTRAQTYDQVQADLVKAEELLPDDAATRNRAQKSIARALRARLHLYREQWAEAENYATQVISNAKYGLVPDYKSFFTTPFQTKELVFELAYSANDRNGFWGTWYPSSFGGSYTLKPSTTIIEQLNNANIGGTRNALIAGSANTVYGVLYNTVSTSTDPSYVIRIAELYLIRAEARANQNKLTDALEDLNQIRKRAKVPVSAAATKADLLKAIEDENGIEFAFEGHRWFDLTRTKRAGAVLGVTNPNYWLFPLPFSDSFSDADFEQNPGY
jgi:hypothetical protein